MDAIWFNKKYVNQTDMRQARYNLHTDCYKPRRVTEGWGGGGGGRVGGGGWAGRGGKDGQAENFQGRILCLTSSVWFDGNLTTERTGV